MNRAILLFMLCWIAGCDPANQSTCGELPSLPPSVSNATGTFLQPESVRFRAATPGIPNLFVVTNNAPGGNETTPDTMAWLSFLDENGRQWVPDGGYGGDSGFAVDPSWRGQCGAGILISPYGVTVGPDGRIYVVDGNAIQMFDLKPVDAGATCSHIGKIDLPGALLANDVAIGPDGSLYVTDSAFTDASKSAIYRVSDPGGAARVERWLELPDHPAPNPITFALIDAHPYLFVATLGSQLDPTAGKGYDGHVLRVEILSDGKPGPVTVVGDLRGMFDGIAVANGHGQRLRVSDLRKRVISDVDPITGEHEEWLDMSGRTPQLGGIGCNDSDTAPVCASAEYRASSVFLFSEETSAHELQRDRERLQECAKRGAPASASKPPQTPGTGAPSDPVPPAPTLPVPPGGDHP